MIFLYFLHKIFAGHYHVFPKWLQIWNFFRDWYYLMLWTLCFFLPFPILYFFFVPESFRFLIAKGINKEHFRPPRKNRKVEGLFHITFYDSEKYTEARAVLKKFLPVEQLNSLQANDEDENMIQRQRWLFSGISLPTEKNSESHGKKSCKILL